MSELIDEVRAAQQDRHKLNQLIERYLPFLKKQVFNLQSLHLEYDDMLSLAMLTFSGCVAQYEQEKGNFLSFCSVCIRNRLLDESRKQGRQDRNLVPLFDDRKEESSKAAIARASIAVYDIKQEQVSLAQEIAAFSDELQQFGINFAVLPRLCPKQVRSRKLCYTLAQEIIRSPLLHDEFRSKHTLAQTALSQRFSISQKTIEKHRKYIVTLVLLMDGEYPLIQSFLPRWEEGR